MAGLAEVGKMFGHTRFQQKVSESRGWGGTGRADERREGRSMAEQEGAPPPGRRKELVIGKRKFGRVTHKLSFGEQLGILVEKEREEEEEGEWCSTLERQDSELSAFSEMDLDEFYIEETPPEEEEVEEDGVMEGFREEKEEKFYEVKTEQQDPGEGVKVSERKNSINMRGGETYINT